jgi:hypothetical protein
LQRVRTSFSSSQLITAADWCRGQPGSRPSCHAA